MKSVSSTKAEGTKYEQRHLNSWPGVTWVSFGTARILRSNADNQTIMSQRHEARDREYTVSRLAPSHSGNASRLRCP